MLITGEPGNTQTPHKPYGQLHAATEAKQDAGGGGGGGGRELLDGML